MSSHPILSLCPSAILFSTSGKLLRWLEDNNLPRPSLWDVEQERKRRRDAADGRAA